MGLSQVAQMEHQESCYREHLSCSFFLLHSQFWKQDALKSARGKWDWKSHPSFLHKAFLHSLRRCTIRVCITRVQSRTHYSRQHTVTSCKYQLLLVNADSHRCKKPVYFWRTRPHNFPVSPTHSAKVAEASQWRWELSEAEHRQVGRSADTTLAYS